MEAVYTNDIHDILGCERIDWGAPENSIQYKKTLGEQEAWRPKCTHDLRDFTYEIKATLGEESGAALLNRADSASQDRQQSRVHHSQQSHDGDRKVKSSSTETCVPQIVYKPTRTEPLDYEEWKSFSWPNLMHLGYTHAPTIPRQGGGLSKPTITRAFTNSHVKYNAIQLVRYPDRPTTRVTLPRSFGPSKTRPTRTA